MLLAALGLTGTISVHGCASKVDDEAEGVDTAEQTVVSVGTGLNVERALHTATLLSTGRVLVVGGRNGATVHCSAEVFDPASQTWSATASMNHGDLTACKRFQHTATLFGDGKVLVAGGSSGQGYHKSTEVYDPATSAWTSISSMNVARYSHRATLLNDGKVMVTGGYGGFYHASAEVWDPSQYSWTYRASMSTARSSHSATRLADGKVLVIGGYNGSVNLASAELYNPADNTWVMKASMPTAQRGHSAVRLSNGKVLVVGGIDMAGVPVAPALYDPATNQWSSGGTMASLRSSPSVDLLSGKVVVAGGVSGGALVSSIEVYDPATNTWSVAPPMVSVRAAQEAVPMPFGRLLITGGYKTIAGDARKEVEVHRASNIDMDLGSLLGPELSIGPASTCFTQNDSTPACVPSPQEGQDVMFTWKALCADTFTFQTQNPSFDAVLSVLDPATMAPIGGSGVGCKDAASTGVSESVAVGLAANQQVVVVIDNHNAVPACGDVKLSISRSLASTPEICDGKDNDCNGSIDEGDPGGGGSCATGNLGVCALGTAHCDGGQVQCYQIQQASSEICDGKDNDCDGQSDEGNPGGGGSCWTGLPGVCGNAIWTCENATYVCKPTIPQGPEVCDGLDNDCDGAVDENNPPGVACTTGLPGQCAAGVTSCATGTKVCQQTLTPTAEVCDGLDNNCDGTVDYFTECWYRCSGGSNADQSCDSNIECPGGVCANSKKFCNGGPMDGAPCSTIDKCAPCGGGGGDDPPCVGPVCGNPGGEVQ